MAEQEGNINIHLSPRRKEFCKLLVHPYKLYEIAFLMGISHETARSMMRSIHDITGIHGYANLVLFLLNHPHLYS